MDATPSPADRDAFEAFVLRYQTAICAIAYVVLRDRARSEEVAQDALLIAWRDRAKVTVTPGWICGIARNLARNAARRRREVVMDREPATDAPDARDALIAREDASAALANLPDKYRDAIAIYYRSDESYAEVATALGITEASARQRVHRGRERLQERLSIVERTLRSTRPGTAFTAAVIAAWAIGRSPSASAATASVPKPPWLLPALCVGTIAATLSVAVVIRAASIREPDTTTPGAKRDVGNSVRRFPLMSRTSATSAPAPPALPSGFTPANAPANAPASMPPTPSVELHSMDFQQAPFDHLMQVMVRATETPIWSTLEPTYVDISVKDLPALDLFDKILEQAHATRTEVEAIRIVERGSSGAAVLGGDTMSLSVRAMPLNRVLDLIEPKLAIPIARVGLSFRVIGETVQPADDQSPLVTLELTDVPAGLVLQIALEQTGYGYERTTGFVITPE
jgi:RNA polymerase sigma factor (sigma-70 family)